MKRFSIVAKVFSSDSFTRALPWLLALVGVSTLILSFFVFTEPLYPQAHGILVVIAQATLVSGLVAVLTNVVRYVGIFSDAVQDVFYGDKHLVERHDIDDIWLKVTTAVTKNKFPDLGSLLKRKILGGYIPTEKDFYYTRYYRECGIKWASRPASLVEIFEEVEITIKLANGLTSTDYQYASTTNSRSNKIPNFFDLMSLKIDGVEHKNCLRSEDYTDEFGETGTRHLYSVPLSGKDTYRIHRKIKRLVSLKAEPLIEYSSRNFILDTTVKFKSSDADLRPFFVSVGTDDFADHATDGAEWAVHKTFDSLMLPNQGYMLVMVEGPC